MQLAPAIVYAMAKEGVFVPNGDPVIATAVRVAERELVQGKPLELAIAHAVRQANANATTSLNKARFVRRVS